MTAYRRVRRLPWEPLTAISPVNSALKVTLLYSLFAIILTYPVVWQLPAAVAGFEGRDSWQHVWYQWWLKETLLELGVWPGHVTHLYYPLGADHPVLALHPYVPLASLPLTVLGGPLVSYNLAFLLSFILSGLAGYFLCRYLCRQTGAALLGGLIFAFYPNRLGHAAAGHLLLTTNYFLPLYALSLLILLKRPSLKSVVWHGLVMVLLALAQPTHIGYGIIPIFLFLVGRHIIHVATQREAYQPSPLPHFASLMAAGLLAAAIFLPFAWPILSQSRQNELDYLIPTNLTEHSTDLLAFALPSPYNPILAPLGFIPPFSSSVINGFRDLEEQLAYPGLAVLGLAGLAIWRQWPAARLWLGLSLLCAVLSLGPALKIGGQVQSWPLPYTWIMNLPFFGWSRTPGRLNETVMLSLAVLAALGAAWLLGRLKHGRSLVIISLMAFTLMEYWLIFPFPVESRPVSNYYYELAQDVSGGGVLEMPVTGSRRASNYAMYYQTVHQHPLAGGYIERDPPGTIELKEFLNQLLAPLPEQTVFAPPSQVQRLAILADLNVKRVVVHPDLMTDRAAQATRAYLPLLLENTIFADENILVYAVEAKGTNHLPVWQVLPDQENWEVVQSGAALRLKEAGYLFIYAAKSGPVYLMFKINDPTEPTQLTLRLNEAQAESHPVVSSPAYTTGQLLLRQGLNYFHLSTEPAQEINFSEISIQAEVD